MKKLLILLTFCYFLNLISCQECGRSSTGASLSVGGEYSEVKQWPWLAPLFKKDRDKFFCSSNIISDRFLLSAAHCIQTKGIIGKKKSDEIYAYLGRYDFNEVEDFALKADIAEIHINPMWKYDALSYDGDIVLLKTVNKITFNNHVKPVCLPPFDASVFEVNGYVAGYGKSEQNSYHETRPKHIWIKSVTQEVCLFSDPIFAQLSSPRNFCAGQKNKNPCKGDSGSGFFVRKGKSYQIYGIVSAATDQECEAYLYVIFTNVPKFIVWIDEIINRSEQRCRRNVKCEMGEYEGALKCHIRIDINEKNCNLNFIDGSNSQVIRLVLIYGTAQYLPVMTQAVQKFENLRELDVGFLKVKYVEREKLRIMKEITYISLFGNLIEDLEADTFADLTKVKKILLASNQLKTLHRDLFKNNVKLEEVWLQDNQLEVLPEGIFSNNFELKNVYAANNKLKTIQINFVTLPKLEHFDFSNNVCIDEWCQIGNFCGTSSRDQMQSKISAKCP